YIVTAIDAKGCEVKDTVYIAPGNCCENIFFPNAFSPNADQLNDSWGMVTSTGLEIEQFAVFDRWGQKVWFTRDPREKWNGLINQSEAALGTYFYLLRYKCLSDDKHYTKTGDFILVK
ncbi:MAG TPA: gliding motility-associated C-terminal domain-containing protein, partial [Chitinophagaceae bacterium]|nr:gliding motility-associated C-terminal domain-containing protein [Chitinophagaceae bacterium]